MARIAFLIERLPPHQDPIAQMAYSLVLQLAEQQHHVQIYSTYRDGGELPPPHPRIEILRPLRKWSWLEVPRLLAMMLDFKPEVLHVVDPHAEALEGYTSALRAVPGFLPLMNRPKLVLSFFDVQAKRIEKLKYLIQSADLITVSNRAQLRTIEDVCREIEFTPRLRPLPAPAHRKSHLGYDHQVETQVGDHSPLDTHLPARELSPVEVFISENPNFIFVPGDLDLHVRAGRNGVGTGDADGEEMIALLTRTIAPFESAALVLGGGWGSIGSIRRRQLMKAVEESGAGARVFITGPLDPQTELLCFRKCRYASFVSLPDGTLQFMQSLQRGLLSEAALVLSQNHVDRDTLPWRNGENAVIVSSDPREWEKTFSILLSSDEELRLIRSSLRDFAREQTLDQPGNIMSRWYAEILSPS